MKGGFGGFPGGNMSGLIKQAQKLQADMQKTQADLETKVLEGSSGGGAVVVEVTGKKELTNIKLILNNLSIYSFYKSSHIPS